MQITSDTVLPRHLAPVVADRMRWAPVVVVGGARTCGKTTMLAECAENHDVPLIDLDDPAMRQLIAQDVTGYLSRLPRPVCVDEFQHNLDLLDAIKTDLNRGIRPGQYLLTGSTRFTTLPKASQSLTGRAHLMTLWPLSQGELCGHKESFLDVLLNDARTLLTGDTAAADRETYENKVLLGGYPMAHMLVSSSDRRLWYRDLLELVIKRDLLSLREVRRRDQIADVVRALAGQTAQILNVSRLASQLGMSANSVAELVALLESVYIVHRLPAYGRTLTNRVGRTPKIHVVDSGFGASLLGVTERKLRAMRTEALAEFGHLVESFTVNELMKQAGWSKDNVEFFHFRTRDQKEVDLVIQADDGRVAAVEVKAGSKVKESDFAGMRLLREHLGDDFVGGALLNLGRLSYEFEPGLFVMPVDTLWRHGQPAIS